MTRSLVLLFAQVGAETKTRVRSTSTLLAALALFAASFLWIQDPASRAVSLSWRLADGGRATGIYSAGFVGLISAVLAAGFLPFVGFYLVAGSVRRDRDTGVGAILAATPLSNTSYLLGKCVAHTVYLALLQALAVLSGALVFWRYGIGPFTPGAFLVPSLLLVTPAVALTAALAILFDVTPGIRGRGGLVVYFFASSFVFFIVPGLIGGLFSKTALKRLPVFDPAGVVTTRYVVSTAIPESVPNTVSVGVIMSKTPVERVPWPETPYSAGLVVLRAAGLLFVIPPLAAAVLAFDRFDPARSTARERDHEKRREGLASSGASLPSESWALPLSRFALRRIVARPRLWSAVLTEARLVWDMASWLRWPLLLASLLSAFTPAATATFLLLLAPVISEVAARESLCGTRGLVFSQPSVPVAPVLWKAAAVAVFVLAFGAPGMLRALATSPRHGVAFLTGLVFVAAFAVGAGSLTGGGKLFTAVYTALWYVSVSGNAGALDYCGAFGGGLEAGMRLMYLGLGAAALGLAFLVEQGRQRG